MSKNNAKADNEPPKAIPFNLDQALAEANRGEVEKFDNFENWANSLNQG